MVAVDFCCFGSCLFVNCFVFIVIQKPNSNKVFLSYLTKPGHHAVTSFTKPGPAFLT